MSAASGVTPESLKALLEEKLGAVHVEIADLSGMRATIRPMRRLPV